MLRDFFQTYIEKRILMKTSADLKKKRKKCLMFTILWIMELKVAK